MPKCNLSLELAVGLFNFLNIFAKPKLSLAVFLISPYHPPTPGKVAKLVKFKLNLNGRRPQWKTTSMEDKHNGRQHQLKATSMEGDLNKRRPQ